MNAAFPLYTRINNNSNSESYASNVRGQSFPIKQTSPFAFCLRCPAPSINVTVLCRSCAGRNRCVGLYPLIPNGTFDDDRPGNVSLFCVFRLLADLFFHS